MSNAVLDASALLALVQNEPGGDRVAAAVTSGAAISAVNLAEVIGKLQERGAPEADIRAALQPLRIAIMPMDTALAYRAGLLRMPTRAAGLALGDRVCLALAQQLGVPALTTDRVWATLGLGVTVTVIR
ncbi:MAG TPA: type II toxin-antitoxin system VapC family toxin [Dehalococcoidia bacterium]|nr:type II toxin-antitoxin system VapC family toxin [Dehalococcoidia bacterium]